MSIPTLEQKLNWLKTVPPTAEVQAAADAIDAARFEIGFQLLDTGAFGAQHMGGACKPQGCGGIFVFQSHRGFAQVIWCQILGCAVPRAQCCHRHAQGRGPFFCP